MRNTVNADEIKDGKDKREKTEKELHPVEQFLCEILDGGVSVNASKIEELAEERGIKQATLYRIKKKCGYIKSEGKPAMWFLG